MRTAILVFALAAIAGCMTEAPTTVPPSPSGEVSEAATTVPPSPSDGVSDSSSPSSESSLEQSERPIVIDVRSESEWDAGHVSQAFHIPHTEIAERISEVTTDKNAKIVVYCAAGGRAGRAKTALENLGFTNVENGGGYDDVKERF